MGRSHCCACRSAMKKGRKLNEESKTKMFQKKKIANPGPPPDEQYSLGPNPLVPCRHSEYDVEKKVLQSTSKTKP